MRSDAGLARAHEELAGLKSEVTAGEFEVANARQVIELSETLNLLEVGSLMITAARLRTESRGSHYREDYPSVDPQWSGPIMIRRGDQGCIAQPGDYSREMP